MEKPQDLVDFYLRKVDKARELSNSFSCIKYDFFDIRNHRRLNFIRTSVSDLYDCAEEGDNRFKTIFRVKYNPNHGYTGGDGPTDDERILTAVSMVVKSREMFFRHMDSIETRVLELESAIRFRSTVRISIISIVITILLGLASSSALIELFPCFVASR